MRTLGHAHVADVTAMQPVDTSRSPTRIGTIDEPVGKTRVLIVEDHGLVAEGLAFALRQEGLDADVVPWAHPHDPEDLVGRVALSAPAVVLLDLDLGHDVVGEALVAPLRACGLTVVVLTGVVDRVRLALCVDAGAVGIAEKNESFDGVLDIVLRAARGEPTMPLSLREELNEELHRHRASVVRRLAPFERLTPREREVLAAVVEGVSAVDIATTFGVSLKTVRMQTSALLQKLGVRSCVAAAAMARQAAWSNGSDTTNSGSFIN